MPKRSTDKARPKSVPGWGRALAAILLAGALAVAFLFGRPTLSRLARRMAAEEMDRWAISNAQLWLDRAIRLDSDQGELRLMRAACHRRWGEIRKWREAMEAAETLGVPPIRIQQEIALGIIRSGEQHEWMETAQYELIESRVPPDDVATAFLDGYLARGDYEQARIFLGAWESTYNNPHVSYLWGFYWLQLQDYEQALAGFQKALDAEPAHELARKMVAELLEMQDDLEAAARYHLESVKRSPSSTVARLGLARTLRKLNRIEDARALLTPLANQPEPLFVVLQEMGQLELEVGNYEEAERWLDRDVPIDQMSHEQLLPAAISSNLLGDRTRALRMLDRYDAVAFNTVRGYDLQIRLSINPRDRESAEALRELQTKARETHADLAPGGELDGAGLYALHCASCHGSNGNGNGRASRHLYPAARDFRTDRFRMVSTVNGVPTPKDIEVVIERGLPGTSMPAFEGLNQEQRQLVAEHVLRLHRDGIRERMVNMLDSQGDEVIEEDVRALVARGMKPGEVVRAPRFSPLNDEAIERGRAAYRRLACHQCHGVDGTGDPTVALYDDRGRPTRARDLVHEPLRGGDAPEAIYLRLVIGMPGTPHPSCRGVPPEELVDLVHFVRSLARSPKETATNNQRRLRSEESLKSAKS